MSGNSGLMTGRRGFVRRVYGARMKGFLLVLGVAVAAACEDGREAGAADAVADATDAADLADAADAAVDAAPASAAVSGHAFNFGQGGPLAGGQVTILELPERTATTEADGAFAFDDLPVGAEVSFVLHYEDFPLIQTGTHVVPPEGMERLTFQAPDRTLYATLAGVLRIDADPARCQIASTVTRRGNSLYDDTPGTHGEPEATVTITPRPEEVDGPVYFDLAKYNVIWPDRDLVQTSADGGVLFLNVPPGDYTLEAHKEGTTFRPVKIKCAAGLLVNASPPWGLQAVEGGVGPRTEPDWQ